ncbi:hypothetical protein [Paenibacillus ferrarius]|uniref:hypothetical protein n=1 Tax=Paenibacillus ferrarius TaxID=1469647 RepID=UPI00117CF7BA|nr:hypothetical protein [Paenibacillus ferrarius]
MIILSLILSFCSSVLDSLPLQTIAPIIQLFILIVLFKVLIKESIIFSILVNALGFIFFNVIEALYFAILQYYAIADISDLGGTHNTTTFTLQLTASLIVFIVSAIIRNLNSGFGFMDKFRSTKSKIKTTNKILAIISFISILLLSVSLYMLLSNKNLYSFMAFLIFVLIFNIILFYFYNKRDKEQFGNAN